MNKLKTQKIEPIRIWADPEHHKDRLKSSIESLDSERPMGKDHYSLFHNVGYQTEMLAQKINEIIDYLNSQGVKREKKKGVGEGSKTKEKRWISLGHAVLRKGQEGIPMAYRDLHDKDCKCVKGESKR